MIMSQLIGKYEILEKLGEGASSDVYRARDTQLGRVVALKVLKPALVPDSSAFGRFIQEAQAAAGLFHPNIATVLDMGEADGRYFISMRYLPGQSLDKILKADGPLSWESVTRMAQQVGAALDYAHKAGFLHRDVKPSNIISTPEGEYILTDFGLVRAMMSTGLTSHTGAVLGTPAYIPPEIWLGEPAVPATDQYALACVVYEALTGKVLFSGDTPPAIMTRHVLKGAELPEALPGTEGQPLQAVLAKALAKNAPDRYPSLGSFTGALAKPVITPRAQEAPPPQPSPAKRQTAALKAPPEMSASQPAATPAALAQEIHPQGPTPQPAVAHQDLPDRPGIGETKDRAQLAAVMMPATPGIQEQLQQPGEAVRHSPDQPAGYPQPAATGEPTVEVNQDLGSSAPDLVPLAQPNTAVAYYERGRALLKAKDLDQAIEHFDRALQLQPTLAEAYLHRAEARRRKKDGALANQDEGKYLELIGERGWGWQVKIVPFLLLGLGLLIVLLMVLLSFVVGGITVLLLPLAVGLISSAIGLWFRKEWARKAGMVLMGLLFLFVIIFLIFGFLTISII
jgi:serine/threonine protein kinase